MVSVRMHNDSIISALFFWSLIFSCHLDCICIEFSYMSSLFPFFHSALGSLEINDYMRDQNVILQMILISIFV